jgi:uncharacterized protein
MTRFTFPSHDIALVGDLYTPDAPSTGIVITTGPLTSVKEQAAGVYARALVERGYTALAFDHRTFGESGGVPRQLENPYAKAEDISAAVTALLARPDLAGQKVYGVGVCAGGGYMAHAVAHDPRFSGFAGVAGVYSDRDKTRAWMGEGYDAAKARAQAAQARFEATGEAETIPAVAENLGDVAMPLKEAYDYYGTPRGQVPSYVNAFAVQSRLHTLDFDVQTLAADITVPTLIVHSQKALAPSLAESFFARLTAPKQELWLTSVGQIDFYDDPRLITEATAAIDKFLMQRR